MPRESVIRLEAAFDVPTARFVECILGQMTPGDRLRIDFSQVRTLEDFGIGVLAQVLESNRHVRVALRGLRLHHVRLLRYFGIDGDAFRPEAVPAGAGAEDRGAMADGVTPARPEGQHAD